MQPDGLAFGVTLAAPAWSDAALCCPRATTLHRDAESRAGRARPSIAAASGRPRRALAATVRVRRVRRPYGRPAAQSSADRARRAGCIAQTRTAPHYRLLRLPGGPPARPGMVRVDDGAAHRGRSVGIADRVVRRVLSTAFPPRSPSARSNSTTASSVKGFLCESYASPTPSTSPNSAAGGDISRNKSANRPDHRRGTWSTVRAEPYEFDVRACQASPW